MTVLVLLAALCSTAWATPRNFPANALRGVFTATVFPQVMINGQTMQLAPGAKIYNQQNMILMHTNLINSAVVVNYTLDNMGFVSRVWILTDEEAAITLPTRQ
ncbi:MAG: hypothetical protein JO002_04140 [Burkholderiaceae bacterium]|nr:hypothetical protein [Burkholderiaceae bacterium]